MLHRIKLKNVGPAPSMELDLGKRLNLITGDNGLGKSFLLDICWWALTRNWPAEVNKGLTSGMMAMPSMNKEGVISFTLDSKTEPIKFTSTFDRQELNWPGKVGRPWNAGLILYAQADGSFAAWDPARNYWKDKDKQSSSERPRAYVFSQREIWDGLRGEGNKFLCEGLIRDWAGWQKERGDVFNILCDVLKKISPSDREPLEPGDLTRISIDDSRDMPTIKMPYGESVPIVHASAGIRRIVALAYLLVWTWEEHKKASQLRSEETAPQIVFVIDEIEAHLHPKWQRKIVQALIDIVSSLARETQVQIIAATHSPLVMASVEPYFDPARDKWFDLDYVENGKHSKVELTPREFRLRGDATNWLTSEAFDLSSGRSEFAEDLLSEASALLEKDGVTETEIQRMLGRLESGLSPQDPFLFRWRGIATKKGLLK